MNINRIIFAIEDCISTLSRYSVSAFFPDYRDLHTVIGLDQQDRERRPWLKALHCHHKTGVLPFRL